MRSQLSSRVVLVATLLIAAYFACAGFYDRWYNSTYSGFLGFEKLAVFEPGTSLDRVAAHYLRSYRVRATDVTDFGASKHGRVLLTGRSFYASPSLIKLVEDQLAELEPGDELHYFEASHGGGSFLQFRNGKLVEFSPKTFQPTAQLARRNGHPVPHAILRFGIWPFYLPVAALLIYCCYRLLRRSYASQKSNGASYSAV